jgi:hypothetical protein
MTRFVPNPNFEKEFTPELYGVLNEAADAIQENAEGIVDEDTGYYNEHFEREETAGGVTLGNSDFAAHIIEFGDAQQGPQAPLRGGVEAAGLRFEESDK